MALAGYRIHPAILICLPQSIGDEMFQHPQVLKTRRAVEVDNHGNWVRIFEVVTKSSLNNDHTMQNLTQAVLNWASVANENWDKLRFVEGE
jgi:hypothetical protein